MGNDTKAALARIARLTGHILGAHAPHGWPHLIVMTDHVRQGDARTILEALPEGAALCLRDYAMPDRAILAGHLARRARERRIRFIVGADVQLALAVGAWGVHMPEGLWRLSVRGIATARSRGLKVTTAVHSAIAARRALGSGGGHACDAIIVSPVFPTGSHPGADTLGPLGLRRIIAGMPVPAYALGGIIPQTLRRLQGTGIAGIAGISLTQP